MARAVRLSHHACGRRRRGQFPDRIPTVEAPTPAEALSAYCKAYAASPLVWDRESLPEITLVALGQCDKARSGPGVACMTSVKMGPQAQPLDRIVGFAKAASGEWIATLN